MEQPRRLTMLLVFLVLAAGSVPAVRGRCSTNPPAVADGAWACAGTPANASCTATCGRGFTSIPPPSATCTGTAWGPVSGSCSRVCPNPPTLPLPGGTWDSNCTSVTTNGVCRGTCDSGLTGMPVVQCLGAAWSTQILGRCLPVTSGASSSASCSEFPPIVVNAQGWPSSVLGTAAGGVATAVCNNGYFAAGTPRATCLSSGIWSTPSPPACEKGPARAGTAFISAGGTSQFVVCTFDGANLTNCVVDPATPGGAPALSHPAGVVTQGTKVWIAEATPIPRVRACVFQTAPLNALTSCAVSDLPGYSPPFESMLEQVAVDPVTNIGYVADYNNDCIVTCLDASAMRLCSCAQLPAGSQPVGLAMSARRDALLITVAGGLFRCTLGPTGLPGSIDDSTCRFFKTSFYPLAVLESDNALWMADGFGIHTCTAPGDAGELACGFSEAGGTLRAAGYVGLALGGGSLLIPNYDLAALSVCSSPAPSVTGCKLQAPRDLSGQPNFNMLGSVAVAVAPA